MSGAVYGTPAASLKNAAWAKNTTVAEIGARGEHRTAEILNRLAHRGAAIFHDITLPGSRANLDHVIVAGNSITIIDTKVWAPGTYWRLFGVIRRGRELFAPAHKTDALPTQAKRLQDFVNTHSAHRAHLNPPLVVVWPSRRGTTVRVTPLNLAHTNNKGVRFISGDRLNTHPFKPVAANRDIVAALLKLTNPGG